MHLVIYGPEGSGKGTQAKLLSEKLALPIYTSGDLVREVAASKSERIGKACREALRTGKYVSDRQMFVLWGKKLETKEAKKGFILDGFPRNINQVKFLMKTVARYGYSLERVIYLKLNDEEALERLAKRHRPLYSGSTIDHDDPERVRKRLKIYRQEEEKALDFFRKENLLLEVDADKSISEVFDEIVERLSLNQ